MTQNRALRWVTGALLVGAGILIGVLATPLARAGTAADAAGANPWGQMVAACTAFMQSPAGQAHHRAMMQLYSQYSAPATPPGANSGEGTR